MLKIFTKLFGGIEVRHKQLVLAGLLGSFITGIISIVLMQIVYNPTIKKTSEKDVLSNMNENTIESIGNKVDPEQIWRYKVQEKYKNIEDQLSEIQKELATSINNKNESDRKNYEDLRSEFELFKNNYVAAQENGYNVPKFSDDPSGSEYSTNSNVFGGDRDASQAQSSVIRKIKINLKDSVKESFKNIEDTIPAGAFAKAVLLGGVDASTALSSQGDPRPLLVRLIDAGTLPRKFSSDLKDCHIVASGYGDISSERVFARLEKLTCVEKGSGEIIETEVAGYIAGEDGRAGIKGVVIEKGRGYLAKSVIGGVLQGVAGVLAPDNKVSINPLGAVFGKRSYQDKFGEGLMAGGAGSMDRLSKYYIERAESIQPIIQVASGRIVDVVFTEGAGIGTQKVKKILEAKRQKEESNVNEEVEDVS